MSLVLYVYMLYLLWTGGQNHNKVHIISVAAALHFGLNTLKVKSMQRSGPEAIRTEIQPSKPKRETTLAHGLENKRIYGHRVSSYFPNCGLSNPNRTKNNINTRKVKDRRNSDTKNRQQRAKTKLPPWNCQ